MEIWKSCGMDVSRVQFLWASKEMFAHPEEYWTGVMDLATTTSVARVLKCTQIMGRSDKDALATSQMMYPIMQCNDIRFLGVDVCQLGLDQRKVNMLARDQARGGKAPLVFSHPMLPGLKEGQTKMSKSLPDTAIFMDDSAEEVVRKIGRAFCPPGVVPGNPCLAYMRCIVFPFATRAGRTVVVVDDHAATTAVFASYMDLETAFCKGDIHPAALKSSLAAELNALLQPTRHHFATDPAAVAMLEQVRALF